MSPTPNRDRARLRAEILSEVIQSPLSLLPAGVALVSGAWMAAVEPSLFGIAGLCGGATVAVLAAAYNILYRGEAIRDRIVARWAAEDKAAALARRTELVRGFHRTSGTQDIAEVLANLYEVYDETRRVLEGPDVTAAHQAYFLPQVERSFEEALEVASNLGKLQNRLIDLLEPFPEPGSPLHATIAGLRKDRVRMIGHLRATATSFERITAEVVKLGGLSLEEAERSLRQLDMALELAKKAQQEIDEATGAATPRPINPEPTPEPGQAPRAPERRVL